MNGVDLLIQKGKVIGIEEGIEIGKTEGIEIGKTEGEIRSRQATLIKLIHHRFPDVDEQVDSVINDIHNLLILEELFDQTLNAETITDIDLPIH